MKQIIFLLSLISSFTLINAQDLKEIQAYSKLGSLRIIAITANDEAFIHTAKNEWKTLPQGEFPEGNVKFSGVYHHASGSRLMLVMGDESIWKYKDEKWVMLSKAGLPDNYSIKQFRAFTDHKIVGVTARALILTDKNEIYHYTEANHWELIDKNGLPEGDISQISSFQKIKGIHYSPYFIVLLNDKYLYKRPAKAEHWEKIERKAFPKEAKIVAIDSYLKTPLGAAAEGRIICSLNDGSIWWSSEKEMVWVKLSSRGLPPQHRIKKLKVFQQNNTSQLLLLLTDNSLWWYTENKGFQAIQPIGLKK